MMQRALPATAILLLLVLTGLNGLTSPGAGPATSAAAHASAEASAAPHPAVPPRIIRAAGSSGNGTYFTTTSVPPPAASQESCYAGACVLAADDPSLNLTSTGDLVAAYTSWTTTAPCLGARPYAETEIGVVVSPDLGATWSAPSYLGNPDCTAPAVTEYPSAWEPSLTSLANGTLVLAYVEYNVSNNATPGGFAPGLSFRATSPMVTYDRLVVVRSFNGGTSWTVPTVLNTSANPTLSAPAYPPQLPVVTATGDTVYVAWMNLTGEISGFGTGSSAVQVATSTNGGLAFGTPVELTTIASAGTSVAMNPSVAVDPSGRLYVAYTTNVSYAGVVGCPSSGCFYGGWTSSVVVAVSTNNGSSFSDATVASDVILPTTHFGPFFDPSPALAVAPSGSQVYVAYASGYLEPLCSPYGCYTGLGSTVSVANSSTSGATFSEPQRIAPGLVGGSQDGANLMYNPAISVAPSGVLELTATFDNYSVCAPGAYGTFCGPQAQIYVNSSDDGATFSSPIYLSDNSTQLLYNPNNPDGEYASALTAGDQLFFAWTSDLCDPWNTTAVYTACLWPSNGGASGIQISTLYHGSGLNLTFTEAGLAVGTVWSADVLGNVVSAIAPAHLVLSGVPDGMNVTWNISVASPYGYRYAATFSSWNPAILTASTTVAVTYVAQVLFELSTVPFLPPYPYGSPYCGSGFYWNVTACPGVNWNITPGPGPEWVTPGTTIPLAATPNNVVYCVPVGTCYGTDILNLTFLSWKGTGASAANTTSMFTNVTVSGPVNETASFSFNGYCVYDWIPTFTTCVAPNESYAFHESGLPNGTSWGVTISSAGQFQSNQSDGAWDLFNSTLIATLVNYTVWTIPDGTTGKLWVPTSTPVSPITPLSAPIVEVNFTLEAASAATFPLFIGTGDLPGGSSWSYSVDGSEYGSTTPIASTLEVSGGSHSVGAASVVLSNSTRYEPTSIRTKDYSGTGVYANFTSSPATFQVLGNTYVTINYTEQYWLEATNSSCGTVTASNGWYNPGVSVPLTATPSPGCTFVGWTGNGPGAVSSSLESIRATVNGPITEFAVFQPTAPPLWNVTVNEGGLVAGLPYSIGIGGTVYAGTAQFTVHGLATGVYGLALPYDYLNGSDGTRFIPSLTSTSLAPVASGYLIDANGWINVTFGLEFLVNVSAGPGGSVTPAGSGWYPYDVALNLVATPGAGDQFVGWAGSGAGAASGTSPTLLLTVNGSSNEVASFAPLPVPVAPTYGLSVTESGLAPGTVWTAEIGATGYATATGQISTVVPNGTFEVTWPVVPGPLGVRYVPTPASVNVTIAGAPGSASVTYTTEYFVSITASAGGSVNVTSGWYPAGQVLLVAATPSNASETFANWTGAGAGSYSGAQATISVTVSGPIAESAAFQPTAEIIHTTASPAPATNGLAIAFGLLVVLLVVGFAVAYLVLRRRPPSEPEPAPEALGEPESGSIYGDPPAAEP
jgi:hypothetical protein